MAREYSMEIAELIEEFLNEDDWNYKMDEEMGVFIFDLSLRCKMKKVKYYINVQKDGFVVNCRFPIGGGEDTQADLLEFINRANYGLRYGNFEMDMRDYEVQFRMSHFCGEGLPTFEEIRDALYRTGAMADRYGDAMLSVIFGGASPKDAIEAAES